jgi:hypothetical protein
LPFVSCSRPTTIVSSWYDFNPDLGAARSLIEVAERSERSPDDMPYHIGPKVDTNGCKKAASFEVIRGDN